MTEVLERKIAGTFYPADSEQIVKQIEFFKQNSKNFYTTPTRAVIVPHAGYVFSGRVAYEGISQLDKNIKNIFIIAPAHKYSFDGLALTSLKEWETPLGKIKVNRTLCNKLIKIFGAEINDEPFNEEHSIEVEIPIIQSVYDKVNIVPVLYGKDSPDTIEKIISEFYEDEKVGFIISSDLSHFYKNEEAMKIDVMTAQMIETGDIRQFKYEQACGAVGIAGLVQFANKNKFSLIRVDLTNSFAVTQDASRVVGYGCWFLLEGDKYEYIEKNYSKFIVDTVRVVLKSHFDKSQVTINYPQIFDQFGASFVTLEKNGQLRGCIGSIIAHQPLINDIVINAKNAAIKDSRFKPLEFEELNEINISVSILTPPRRIDFSGEEDLLNKIEENADGIIIRDSGHQAVYLPSVWKDLPDKKEFLNSLKVKAGLRSDYFSETFEAYKFSTIYIKED